MRVLVIRLLALISDELGAGEASTTFSISRGISRQGFAAPSKNSVASNELAAEGDHNGAAVWRRITAAVAELANKVPPGPVH